NQDGVYIQTASGNTIGGTTTSARNVISGNTAAVEFVGSASGNVVEGNYIGTDVTGTKALGNSYAVNIFGSASDNTIGGTATGAGNVIAGNTEGITILGADNLVEGNLIGTDATGTVALGGAFGVALFNGASGNTIGGTAAA